MSASDSAFLFVDDPAAFCDAEALVVRVPAKARGKEKLLNILSEKLRFPRYFGHNWDALEECLGDLSWLNDSDKSETKRVVIVHESLPFSAAGDQLAIYLGVLHDAAAVRNAAESGPKLTIVFATQHRDAVAAR